MNSAAIYLLDDNTEFLNARAVVGLPMERLNAEPRTLRGSRADLEALVQDAVLMDDLYGVMGETWNAPEEAGAAVCTALFKDDLPIGTLWLFADEPRDLDEAHATIAQMASTQITLQLADAAAVRSLERGQKSRETINHVAAWQYSSLPVGNHLAPGWFADGMIESPEDWAIGWHAWDVMPDGSLMLAIAEASEMGGEGAMVAATARAAMTSHSGYRHTPAQMLQRVGDTMWNTNTADQLVSMMYLRLDPETGEGEIAAAGRIGGLIAGRFGYRPLIGSVSRPLASSIDVDSYQSTFNLAAGETLMAYGAGLKSDGISQELLGCCLRSATQSTQKPLTMLRREMAAFPVRHERGLIALSRASENA